MSAKENGKRTGQTYPGSKFSALRVGVEAVLSMIFVIGIVKLASPTLSLPALELFFLLIWEGAGEGELAAKRISKYEEGMRAPQS